MEVGGDWRGGFVYCRVYQGGRMGWCVVRNREYALGWRDFDFTDFFDCVCVLPPERCLRRWAAAHRIGPTRPGSLWKVLGRCLLVG